MRTIVGAVALVTMAVVAGCGADDHGHGHDHAANSPVPAGARTVEVIAEGLRFQPEVITASVGEPIEIVLNSVDIDHDLVIDEFDAHVYADGGSTATGGFVATEAGEFTIYCLVPGHREGGMEGTLLVES